MDYYVCPRCKYTTKNKWNLKTHFEREKSCKVAVNGQDIPVEEALQNLFPKKPYECPFCDKSFKSDKGYTGHIFKFHYDKKRRVLEEAIVKLNEMRIQKS